MDYRPKFGLSTIEFHLFINIKKYSYFNFKFLLIPRKNVKQNSNTGKKTSSIMRIKFKY